MGGVFFPVAYNPGEGGAVFCFWELPGSFKFECCVPPRVISGLIAAPATCPFPHFYFCCRHPSRPLILVPCGVSRIAPLLPDFHAPCCPRGLDPSSRIPELEVQSPQPSCLKSPRAPGTSALRRMPLSPSACGPALSRLLE